MQGKQTALTLKFFPLTPSRWPDLVSLFGARGACGGCWCMAWRLPHSKWAQQKGTRNRNALRKIVNSGPPPGVLAYAGKKPIGWCALAPREQYVALGRSRVLAPLDAQPVWSISCFFVEKSFRKRGVSVVLLKAAVAFAKKRGAKILEGYPYDYSAGKMPDVFVWTGLPGTFLKAGFSEAARRSSTRPILRRVL
jgi:GNAT superfamily N-acetyltransferase